MVSYEKENILNLIFNSITLLDFNYALKLSNKTLHRIIYKNLNHKLFLKALGNSKITFNGQRGYVSSIIPFKENSIISSSPNIKAINIWDINTKTLIKTITTLDYIYSLLILPNGNLVSASDSSTDIWNLNDDLALKKTLTFNKSFTCFRNLIMLANNNIACIAIFRLKDCILILNSCNYSIVQILTGHSYRIYALATISSDTFASCSDDGTIKIWKFTNDKFLFFKEKGYENIHTLVNEHKQGFQFITVSNKGDLLLSAYHDCIIKLWDENLSMY
jgi:WD40 repeat protein